MDTYLLTERLVLRRLTADDEDNLVALDGDPEVMRYLTGGKPTPRAKIREEVLPRLIGYYQRSPHFGLWAAEVRDSGEFIGWFALRPDPKFPDGEPELGYRLRRSSWGKGYATEGSLALIAKAFTELGAARVNAETMAVNLGSRHVMERCGLRHVRTLHRKWDDPIPGTEQGEVEYAIERDDWLAAQ